MTDTMWQPWAPDILGPGFESATLRLGPDPDGEGEAVATLVRRTPVTDGPAVLWIHGMTDYFFQDHLAAHLAEAGYAFYALDLRKCGRSHRHGQRWHYTSDLRHYHPELTAALDYVAARHPSVVPMAHSTGGLISVLWFDWLRRARPELARRVAGMVLDSPWLALQYGARNPLIAGAAHVLGRLRPGMSLPGGDLNAYGESIAADWDFDECYKPVAGTPKYAGWLLAVVRGMEQLRGGLDLHLPVLTLTSDRSWLGQPYSAASDTADTVLDVAAIWPVAESLGEAAEVVTVPGARHDVYLSLPLALEQALTETTDFLDRVTGAETEGTGSDGADGSADDTAR
ncbi:alpha/beta fold hydrolase [Corynebacterium frankenforstense]